MKGHRGHAFCGDLCVPHFLHDEFAGCLGAAADQFDLLAWYVRRDRQRRIEQSVVAEPITWWRSAFRAELSALGLWKPAPKPRPIARPMSGDPIRLAHAGSRYTIPCPHTPLCPNTRTCCAKQDHDRDRPDTPVVSRPAIQDGLF